MKKLPALGLAARALIAAAASLPVAARAHPGHDGDHDFTWEFGHLVDHPIATLGCCLVIAAGVWTAGRVMRRRAEAARKLRTE